MCGESGGRHSFDPIAQALAIGYTQEQIGRLPEDSISGAGCANPVSFAELQPGETVLDIGCGGGMDLLLAADAVGQTGRVIGIDEDSKALELARLNADGAGLANVALRRGRICGLPVDDHSVDVILSNCAINYADDLRAGFGEMQRCLRRRGRMIVADLVLTERLDEKDRRAVGRAWREWLDGAATRGQYLSALRASFGTIDVLQERSFNLAEADQKLRGRIVSLVVRARP